MSQSLIPLSKKFTNCCPTQIRWGSRRDRSEAAGGVRLTFAVAVRDVEGDGGGKKEGGGMRVASVHFIAREE